MSAAQIKKSHCVIAALGGLSAAGGGGVLLRVVESQPWLGYTLILLGALLEIVLGIAVLTVELADRATAIWQRERRERRRDQMLRDLPSRVSDEQVAEIVKQQLQGPPPRRRPPDRPEGGEPE